MILSMSAKLDQMINFLLLVKLGLCTMLKYQISFSQNGTDLFKVDSWGSNIQLSERASQYLHIEYLGLISFSGNAKQTNKTPKTQRSGNEWWCQNPRSLHLKSGSKISLLYVSLVRIYQQLYPNKVVAYQFQKRLYLHSEPGEQYKEVEYIFGMHQPLI